MDYGAFTGMPAGGGIGAGIGAMAMIPKLTRGVMRRNVDYSSSIITHLEDRIWQRGKRDRPIIQPDAAYVSKMVPPLGSEEDPVTAITTKFVKTVYNKQRCPIFCTSWAPDGRRLVAGAASGEFSLWSGISLNFESLIKAHEGSVRCMQWSHNALWMASTDDRGVVKYWQSNMNNVHSFQAHNETIRGCSFSPTDAKLATCSDDGTVRVFDVLRSAEEFILRGHGADVKCIDWHPRKNLLVSGNKDNQQPIKLWDPKAGQGVSTIHAHKAAVTCVRWNRNGNWLLTASRDHLIKLYDIRTMKELEVLKGHKSDVNTVSWHPVHEKLFSSGGSDGAILFWLVGNKRDIGGMESPHDSFVWSLAWHPLGHMLCSGSNDHTCKFWCRNHPGDEMKDRHTSGGLPVEEMADSDIFESVVLPGAAHSNITLPPPTKISGGVILPSPSNNPTWTAGQTTLVQSSSDKPPAPSVDFPLQVLGADIIKEQLSKQNVPPAAPGQNQNIPPAKSGLFMHLQGGESKEGGQQSSDFGSPFHPNQSPPAFPHQNPMHVPAGGMGSPGMRGPPQNFHGPRPPPMQQQNRREWHEGGGDFPGRPRYPQHEFPHRFNMRSNLQSNPFSWQRQDHGRDRQMSFEEEGMRFHEQEHNPYVYRREEGSNRLRDPREQRMQQALGMGDGNSHRLSQDEQPASLEWQNRSDRGPPWRQEHRSAPDHPNQPPTPGSGQEEFHNLEQRKPPPTQEHFDQQGDHGGKPTPGPPQQNRQVMEQLFQGGNWRPPFRHPLHEGPQNNQGHPPQKPNFPPDMPNFRPHQPRSEQEPPPVPVDNQGKGGPPIGDAPPPPEQRGPTANVHDPRSQRAQPPPTSQPNRPNFPPHEGPPQHFPEDPSRDERPQHLDGGRHPHQLPIQVRDAPQKPHNATQQHPTPHIRDGHPHLPPQPIHEGAPHLTQQGHDVPHQIPPHHREGPHHPPPQSHQAPPPVRDAPPHQPQHVHDGRPPPNHEGPPKVHDVPLRPPPLHIQHPQHVPDGAQQNSDRPPMNIHEGPPQRPYQMHDGPPQQQNRGPPLQNVPHHPPHIHDGPQQHPHQVHEGPPHQVHEGPPHHIRDGPPPLHANSPHQPQRFEEFHDRVPPQGEPFFNKPGGQNSPHRVESPITSQPHPFLPPQSRPPPVVHNAPHEISRGGPPPVQRFPGPHPAHVPEDQEHFHSPQHFPDHHGPPPSMQAPPPQNFSGPPPHGPMQREHPHEFPPEQQPPQPPLSGPSDPRRQHPPQNFQGGPPESRPGDRFLHHPHYHPGPPPQVDWGGRQQPLPQQRHNPFPREPGGRFEANRDRDPPPHHDRRMGGRGGEGREGRDKRDRDRDRDRDGRGRSQRERSPKHHASSRDGQPVAKRSKNDRERDSSSSSKQNNNRREKSSRK